MHVYIIIDGRIFQGCLQGVWGLTVYFCKIKYQQIDIALTTFSFAYNLKYSNFGDKTD